MPLLDKLRELHAKYDRRVADANRVVECMTCAEEVLFASEEQFHLDFDTREALGQAIDVFERLKPHDKPDR